MTIAPEDLVLISIDDHTIEPPDLFERHVPSRLADAAPRVITDEATGDCFWEYAGSRMPNIGIGAVAGRPNDEWGFEPSRFEDMRRGCFDVHERVRDLNIAGVMALRRWGRSTVTTAMEPRRSRRRKGVPSQSPSGGRPVDSADEAMTADPTVSP